MSGAKNNNSRDRKHGFYEYFYCFPTNEATVGHGIIAHVKAQQPGLLILDRFLLVNELVDGTLRYEQSYADEKRRATSRNFASGS